MSILLLLGEAGRDALLNGDKIKRRIISVARGEIENAQSRKDWKDGDGSKIIKKLVESNKEVIKATSDPNKIEELKYENEVLKEFLPRELSVIEIASQLTAVCTDILATGSPAKGMGVAMKYVKERGFNVDSKNVKICVDRMFKK